MAAANGNAPATSRQTHTESPIWEAGKSLGALLPLRGRRNPATSSLRPADQILKRLIYTPILPWQTRLLKLLPGRSSDPLRCELRVADITFATGMGVASEGSMVEFDALSYSWGRPELTASIKCNHRELPIPPAMADALKHLRNTTESRWLWCDAICINQIDASEKSSQVKTMLTIFAKARKIVAWLGLPKDETALLSDKVIAASSVSFWSRAWIYQEVFAAQALELRWGHTILTTGQFDNIAHCKGLLSSRGKVNLIALSELSSARETHLGETQSRRTRHGGSSRWNAANTLQFLLSKGRHQEVSDDRDRLYAMLGVLNNMSNNALVDFPIDYSKTIEEVSTDLSGFLLTSHRYGLGWLYHLNVGKRSPLLPSWAFDLRDFAKISDQISVIYGLYLQTLSLADPEDLLSGGRLRVRGCCEGILGGPAIPWGAWQIHSSTAKDMLEPVLQHYILRKVRTRDGNHELQCSGLYCPPSAQSGDLLYSFVGAPGIAPFIIRAMKSDRSETILQAQILGPACWATEFLHIGFQDVLTVYRGGYGSRATSQDFFNCELGHRGIGRGAHTASSRPNGQTDSRDQVHELYLV